MKKNNFDIFSSIKFNNENNKEILQEKKICFSTNSLLNSEKKTEKTFIKIDEILRRSCDNFYENQQKSPCFNQTPEKKNRPAFLQTENSSSKENSY